MDRAFLNMEDKGGFVSREDLSAAHSALLDQMEEEMLARIDAMRERENGHAR